MYKHMVYINKLSHKYLEYISIILNVSYYACSAACKCLTVAGDLMLRFNRTLSKKAYMF